MQMADTIQILFHSLPNQKHIQSTHSIFDHSFSIFFVHIDKSEEKLIEILQCVYIYIYLFYSSLGIAIN